MRIRSLMLVAVLATAVFSFGLTASAQIDNSALIAQLQAQIQSLMQQIQQLVAQQNQGGGNNGGNNGGGATGWCYTFSNSLGYANSGSVDVANLHIVLDKEGISYSPDAGNTYSQATMRAVIQLQQKYGIAPATGYVGIRTKAKLNSIYSCTTVQPPVVCTPSWQPGAWSACTNGQQTRTAYDSNNCGVTTNQPTTTQSCTTVCSPSWQIGAWSACTNGQQTRTVSDLNNCGLISDQPSTTQSCTMACIPNWQCVFGPCTNGYKSYVATDLNNCGLSSSSSNLSCSTIQAQACTTACTPSWQPGAWSACTNGQQTRTVSDSNNCGITTGQPATMQACLSANAQNAQNYSQSTSTCTCLTWSDWGNCNSSGWLVSVIGSQSKNCLVSSPSGCSIAPISQTCTMDQVSPGCFCRIWTDWGSCTNGTQTKTCTLPSMGGCSIPSATQTCGASTCKSNWVLGGWGTCINGQQTRTNSDFNNCTTPTDVPATTQSCCHCTSFSDWSACTNGWQFKTCQTTDPSGCTNPDLPKYGQSCMPTQPGTSGSWTDQNIKLCFNDFSCSVGNGLINMTDSGGAPVFTSHASSINCVGDKDHPYACSTAGALEYCYALAPDATPLHFQNYDTYSSYWTLPTAQQILAEYQANPSVFKATKYWTLYVNGSFNGINTSQYVDLSDGSVHDNPHPLSDQFGSNRDINVVCIHNN